MHDILNEILGYKKQEVEASKKLVPLDELEKMPFPELRDFKKAIIASGLCIIAEIKRKSPSAGIIRSDFDPVHIASLYEHAGADAISVLTDTKFFGGDLEYLKLIRSQVSLPLLRKDFIIDPYQIIEARAAGADAILLIVSALSKEQLADYLTLARSLDLVSLVEVHTADEVEIALRSGADLIGINNRNLATFTVDLMTSIRLKNMIPESIITVSESGIKNGQDTSRLANAGFNAVLVGETLMRDGCVAEKIRVLKECL